MMVTMGPVEGDAKWQLLGQAELSISGSRSENFGMSIAESLAAGVPVIATEGTPWQSVREHRCGWWVPVGCNGLAAAITEATSLETEELSRMGQRGAAMIESQYSWDVIAAQTTSVYRWLLDKTVDMPAHVHLPPV